MPAVPSQVSSISPVSVSDSKSKNVISGPKKVDFIHCLPFVFLHVACFAVIWVGWSPIAVITAIALYFIRMFALTAFYHRYFSHKTFKTSRPIQFIFAIWGNCAVQKGPLWWAAHHRVHHRLSDQEGDVHSPKQGGFWWSHIGWITSKDNLSTDYILVQDFAKFPELVFLNRFDWLVPILFGLLLLGIGALLHKIFPALGTSGPQFLVWGFFISTIILFHGTSTINSLSHLIGSRRYETRDTSRNNFFLALLTLGEGWHNNHHRFPNTVRQGFFWWEVDITYYVLKLMSWLGLIYDLKPIPALAYARTGSRKPKAGK